VLDFLLPAGLVESDPPYWFAIVSPKFAAGPTGHGAEVASPPDATPNARFLLLEPGGAADAFMSKYDQQGSFMGDTWYATREEALQDASEEFGPALGEWRPVPASDIGTAERYVLGRLAT
jgi:hypothetical protein